MLEIYTTLKIIPNCLWNLYFLFFNPMQYLISMIAVNEINITAKQKSYIMMLELKLWANKNKQKDWFIGKSKKLIIANMQHPIWNHFQKPLKKYNKAKQKQTISKNVVFLSLNLVKNEFIIILHYNIKNFYCQQK